MNKLDDLPSPSDKAAALEAALTAELSEDDPSFVYCQLGERLQRLKDRREEGAAAELGRRLRRHGGNVHHELFVEVHERPSTLIGRLGQR